MNVWVCVWVISLRIPTWIWWWAAYSLCSVPWRGREGRDQWDENCFACGTSEMVCHCPLLLLLHCTLDLTRGKWKTLILISSVSEWEVMCIMYTWLRLDGWAGFIQITWGHCTVLGSSTHYRLGRFILKGCIYTLVTWTRLYFSWNVRMHVLGKIHETIYSW
jgi:hypothetical protein